MTHQDPQHVVVLGCLQQTCVCSGDDDDEDDDDDDGEEDDDDDDVPLGGEEVRQVCSHRTCPSARQRVGG